MEASYRQQVVLLIESGQGGRLLKEKKVKSKHPHRNRSTRSNRVDCSEGRGDSVGRLVRYSVTNVRSSRTEVKLEGMVHGKVGKWVRTLKRF